MPIDVDALAQEIRRVDGNHSLGAGALAEALMPFLAASPSDAERHERAVPDAWQPKFKQDVIDHHRAQNPDFCEWTMTVFQTKEQAENYGHGGHEVRPLYAAPPAAVQEPVAVKVKPLEWRRETPYHVARVFGNLYVIEVTDGFIALSGIGGRRDFPSFEAAKAFAKSDYEAKIRSALSTSQSDAAPEIAAARQAERDLCNEIVRKAWGDKISVDAMAEIAALRAENERLRKALQPFADRADRYNEIPGIMIIGDSVELWQLEDNKGMRVDFTVADLRRARAAVAPEQEGAK